MISQIEVLKAAKIADPPLKVFRLKKGKDKEFLIASSKDEAIADILFYDGIKTMPHSWVLEEIWK